jgi:predicted MFS family arabinose efflux permease
MERARLAARMPEVRSLLENLSFRRLWAAQFSTVAVVYGLNLAGVALVERWTQSSAQTGLVILSSILPAFVGSLVAGAVVDRFGQVRALMGSHLSRGLVMLVFWAGALLLPSGVALVGIYLVNALTALLAQFAAPAEMALLPDIAGRERLMAANTLFQLSYLAAEGVGIVALGPLVIKLFGAPAVGLLGALLCALAFLLVTPLLSARGAEEVSLKKWPGWASFGADLKAGWRVIVRDRLLRLVTVQMTVAGALLLVLLSLVPGLVSRQLGMSAEDAPILMLPGGIGFVLGAALVTRWQDRLNRQRWIAVGLIGVGLSVALLSWLIGGGARLPIFVALTTGIGLTLAWVIIPARTVLQGRPQAEVRGRVVSAQLALGNVAAALPLLMGGALADRWGIRPVMGALGLLAVGAGIAGLNRAED